MVAEHLLTPAEAARTLRISLKTLRGHIADGSLPSINVGRGTIRRRCVIDPADLQAFKDLRKTRVAPKYTPTRGRVRRSTAARTYPTLDFAAMRAELRNRGKK